MVRGPGAPCGRVLLVVACMAGCGAEERRFDVERPVVRFIEHVGTSPAGVAYGTGLELEHDRRPTLASVPRLRWGGFAVEGGAPPTFRLEPLPAHVRTWGHSLVVEREIGDRGMRRAIATHARVGSDGVVVIPARAGESALRGIAVVLRSGAPPSAYDVETPEFTVPAGAVLRFAVGVDAPHVPSQSWVAPRVEVIEPAGRRLLWQETRAIEDVGWREHRVALTPWALRTIRLRFSGRPGPGAVPSAIAVFGDPTVLAPRPAASPPLGVLLISMDTLRAKSIGTYGCARPTTPAIDALAAEGVLFENAFSPAAYTLPGHASMITGLWTRTHGLLTAGAKLDPAHRGLGEVMREAGWATGAFTSSGAWLEPETGFGGFDTFVDQEPPFLPPPEPEPYGTFTRGLDWMATRGRQPFFAFVQNFQVHRPYLPPAPYDELFSTAPFDGTPENQQLRYEREVRYADDQVRALLDGVEWSGLRDRTLVILTADHGEAFFEHGWLEHTYDVHDEVARIPLIVRLPGALPAGRRITEPVSLVDLVPTIIDLFGLPPVPGVDGTSLLPLMTSAAGGLSRRAVFTEAESGPRVGWTDLLAVHTRSHSCVHRLRDGTHECYDRRTDPWQLGAPLGGNGTGSEPPDARAAFEEWLIHPPALGSLDADMPAERRERLRALGYVE